MRIVSVGIVSNLTCNAHAPYCIAMCPVSLYQTFPHYLINGTVLGNKLLKIKCVF
jgi:hypothetical protein